ncbi:helicase [Cytobacillus sp. Sa5YUA1]|uniref:Helicase n=1 Tax=Cytobacillus stercorigallinarum TaxID=2762240 RepID=A0ABR8QRV6_9BACI|nr:helicase [Cytobacillus stercorigallinarum]MBD7938281.1 helicase [Cytobacillus stercorigallinarum]
MRIYPDCPVVTKTIEIGGLSKMELIQRLQEHSISMNQYGEKLLSDDKFTTSEKKYSLEIVELAVRDFGFPDGATMPGLIKKANQLGLELCPLEIGPYLRLEYLDQPEGNSENSSKQNQAPSGSITIATEIVSDDDDFPKGFYLRRIDGVLWLRGYVADDVYVWNPDDQFIFSKTK